MNTLSTTEATDVASATKSEAIRGVRAAIPVMLGFVSFALVLGGASHAEGAGRV
ncbi:hypothetical protein [Vogesella fluminis]|uniref:Branched-chain amino acid ABC transporter permease n=1 Tax=Vogesella fluminis TaxID=1069161 RepID=A0ABQ3H6B9_9NEIS|nr:hypothetical protein [Vogesella fluminis]GHD72623.1 hypothetical protein GCM10011419_06110 [Vogesella fluminis]